MNVTKVNNYLIELVVIVFGILLALAADAAWDHNQDRQEEREIIEALSIEFQRDAEELEEDQSIRVMVLKSFELLSKQPSEFSISQKREALKRLFSGRFYAPNHAVLDDVLNTARIGLIGSDKLRQLIMTFEHERETQIILENNVRNNSAILMREYLATQIDLLTLFSGNNFENSSSELNDEEADKLIEKDQFRSLLFLAWRRVEVIYEHGSVLLDIVYRIQQELEANI